MDVLKLKEIVVLGKAVTCLDYSAVGTNGREFPSGNIPFAERNFVRWMPGGCTQKGKDHIS
jgi:hypothetical protein